VAILSNTVLTSGQHVLELYLKVLHPDPSCGNSEQYSPLAIMSWSSNSRYCTQSHLAAILSSTGTRLWPARPGALSQGIAHRAILRQFLAVYASGQHVLELYLKVLHTEPSCGNSEQYSPLANKSYSSTSRYCTQSHFAATLSITCFCLYFDGNPTNLPIGRVCTNGAVQEPTTESCTILYQENMIESVPGELYKSLPLKAVLFCTRRI